MGNRVKPASRRVTLAYHVRRHVRRLRIALSDACLWLSDRIVQDDPYEEAEAARLASVECREGVWEVKATSDRAAWLAFERMAELSPKVRQ